jgi:tryptophanyl-tRNA synthetase
MTEPTTIPARKRVLSGMRPTGRLHLGNYMGALKNWVALQNETNPDGSPTYDCYFFIADYHALTTDYADTSRLKQNVYDLALDFLAGGLDPGKSTVFIQSHVPQHAELNLIFSMFTSLSLLERVPTYKDQQEQLREKHLATYGFLGYPLLQAADILLYRPAVVPVGQDQVAHVEFTREVARRFNYLYGTKGRKEPLSYEGLGERFGPAGAASMSPDRQPRLITSYREEIKREDGDPQEGILASKEILPAPNVLLTTSPKLPGIDGRKMSKSYGNTIGMTDSPMLVQLKVRGMSNGGQRITQDKPGDPELCPVADLHRIFSEPEVDAHIRDGCIAASIRCDECKELVGKSIARLTSQIASRRMKLKNNPDWIWKILDEGTKRAKDYAETTMQEVRKHTGLSRDRSDVRTHQSVIGPDENKNARDLTALKDLWDVHPALLVRSLREVWWKDIVPVDAALRQDSEGLWLTRNNRRVFVTAATQTPGGEEWHFSVKPKSYEILVLLCWGKDFLVRDFVIPQKRYLIPWTNGKRASGGQEIKFWVFRDEGKYFLQFPNTVRIPITDAEATYDIICN